MTSSTKQRKLGRYELKGLLGKGGMAVVYLAWDPNLKREVAVKVMRGDRLETEKAIRRFNRELLTCSRLNHPGIVRIFDHGMQGSEYFFVMERVRGQTLDKVIAREGKLPVETSLTTMKAMLDALTVIHENKLLHRDIKPSNVMMEAEGRVVLMDFGLAYDPSESRLTESGYVMGTPRYLPPEVLRGQPATEASDIFQIGLLGYEMLTGQSLLAGRDMLDIVRYYSTYRPAPVSEEEPSVPAELDAVMMRCLEPDPSKRYGSARAMRRDLSRIHPTQTRIPAARPSREAPKTRRRRRSTLPLESQSTVSSDRPGAGPGAKEAPHRFPMAAVAGALGLLGIGAGVGVWVLVSTAGTVSVRPPPAGSWEVTRRPRGGEVRWTSSEPYAGQVEVEDVAKSITFAVQETAVRTEHTVPIPSLDIGQRYRIRVRAEGGTWSLPADLLLSGNEGEASIGGKEKP